MMAPPDQVSLSLVYKTPNSSRTLMMQGCYVFIRRVSVATAPVPFATFEFRKRRQSNRTFSQKRRISMETWTVGEKVRKC